MVRYFRAPELSSPKIIGDSSVPATLVITKGKAEALNYGGHGNDYIADIIGTDDLNGGGGDDTLDARGADQDGGNGLLNGDFGFDTCFFDEGEERSYLAKSRTPCKLSASARVRMCQ